MTLQESYLLTTLATIPSWTAVHSGKVRGSLGLDLTPPLHSDSQAYLLSNDNKGLSLRAPAHIVVRTERERRLTVLSDRVTSRLTGPHLSTSLSSPAKLQT